MAMMARMGRPRGEASRVVRLPLPVAALAKRLASGMLRAGEPQGSPQKGRYGAADGIACEPSSVKRSVAALRQNSRQRYEACACFLRSPPYSCAQRKSPDLLAED